MNHDETAFPVAPEATGTEETPQEKNVTTQGEPETQASGAVTGADLIADPGLAQDYLSFTKDEILAAFPQVSNGKPTVTAVGQNEYGVFYKIVQLVPITGQQLSNSIKAQSLNPLAPKRPENELRSLLVKSDEETISGVELGTQFPRLTLVRVQTTDLGAGLPMATRNNGQAFLVLGNLPVFEDVILKEWGTQDVLLHGTTLLQEQLTKRDEQYNRFAAAAAKRVFMLNGNAPVAAVDNQAPISVGVPGLQ